MAKVSIITPTYNREQFLGQTYSYVRSQTYPDIEWLILDDSRTPSKIFPAINTTDVRYEHTTQRLSIGEKRNRLVDRAKGSIIVNFDDDDFYAPTYVSTLVTALQEKLADLINLRAWFLYDVRNQFFGYWDLMIEQGGLHYQCGSEGVQPMQVPPSPPGLKHTHLGFGFGWAYYKHVWSSVRYQDRDWNEDGGFALTALNKNFKLAGIKDTNGVCLHIPHASNSSSCFPQYRLPDFMLPKYFPQLDIALTKI